jgi:hypothetical protein
MSEATLTGKATPPNSAKATSRETLKQKVSKRKMKKVSKK